MTRPGPRPRILVAGHGDVARAGYLPALLRLGLGVEAIVESDDASRGLASRTASAFADVPPAADFATGPADRCLAINLTPAPLHAEVSRKLLAQGWDVLTEKPAAPDAAQWRELVRVARDRSRRIVSAPFTGASPPVAGLRGLVSDALTGPAHLDVNLCRGGPLANGAIAASRMWFFSSELAALDDLGHYGLAVLVSLWGRPDRIEPRSHERDLHLLIRGEDTGAPQPRTVQVCDLTLDLAWSQGRSARLSIAYDAQRETRYNVSATVGEGVPTWISLWDYTLPRQEQREVPLPPPMHVRPPASMRYEHALRTALRLLEADSEGELTRHQSQVGDVLEVIDDVRRALRDD